MTHPLAPPAMADTCTCDADREPYAAAWHDEDCPRYQNQCTRCDGEGYILVRLGCGCCDDREDCDWCDATGNAPTSVEAP